VSVPFLDLARALAEERDEVDAALARVLDSGRLVLGEAVEEFERSFAGYCGTRHAVGVASGTDALALALQAVGVGPGDEVVTAANTCVPTVAAIESAGATPVLADVDPHTHTLDPADAERVLTPRTRALVPVHLYGQCADMDALAALARAHGLKLVEDAAQAHGAAYGDRRAGALGDAAAFSFYPTKNLGALGDAGAVVTADAEVADRVRLLRNYGERERYESVASGRNSRLDALQAAVLSLRLTRLDERNERRRAIAAAYDGALAGAGAGVAVPVEAERRRHAYHLYVVRSPRRDELRRELAARGVQTLVHYPRPVHRHPAYAALSGPEGALARSERLCSEVLSLPLHPHLSDAEAEQVIDAVLAAARRPAVRS
jgi:dTDP-4-amino-4,6-dideoxygalactose transaminase